MTFPPRSQLSGGHSYTLSPPFSGFQVGSLTKHFLTAIIAFAITLSSAVFCGVAEGSVGASATEGEVQTTSNLNLRQSPTTASKILVTIPEGKVLTVERPEGDWLYVEYAGHVGWVHGDYVRTTRSLAGWIVEVSHHTMPGAPDQYGRVSPVLRAKGTEFFKYKGRNFSGSAYAKPMRQGTPLRVLADEGLVLKVVVHRLSTLVEPGSQFYVAKDDVRPVYDPREKVFPSRPPRASLKSFAVFRKYRRHFLNSSVEWTQYLEVVSGGASGGALRVRDFSGVKALQRNDGGDLFLRREEVVDIDPKTMGALGLYNPLGRGPPSPPESGAYSYKENHAYVGWKIEQFPWDEANNLPAPPGTISGLPLSRVAALKQKVLLLMAAIGGLMYFLLPDIIRKRQVAVALVLILTVLAVPALKVGAYQTLHQERYQEVMPYIEAQKDNGEIRPLAMPLGLTQADISSYRWWFGVDRKARNLFRWLLVLWLPLTIPRLHYFFVPHPLEVAFRRILRGKRPAASAAEYARSSDEWDSWKPAWWHKNQRLRLEGLHARVARETERLRNVLRRRRERGS